MTTGEILRAAARRVRSGLWFQGSMFEDMTPWSKACALGSIERCAYDDAMEADSIAAFVETALCLDPGPNLRPIASWNDAEGQTAENVAAGLEYAALLWEQEQAQPANAEAAPSEKGVTESARKLSLVGRPRG